MRIVDRSAGKPLEINDGKRKDLEIELRESRMRSDSARDAIEKGWMDDLRQYAGVPMTPSRNTPIEEAPNIEITLGAIAVEGIYANLIELFFQSGQFVTVLPRKNYEDYADAVQDYVDWGCRESFNVEDATNTATFDCIRLGTMDFYIPYVEKVKVTDVYKVIDRGPKIIPVAIEDFHLPEGSRGNVQEDRWCEMDLWLSLSDVRLRAKRNDWDLGDEECNIKPAPNISQVRQKRLDIAGEQSDEGSSGKLYNICYRCQQFDIDDDGIDEELEVIWDKTSGSILSIRYPKYDVRPFEHAVYQIQPHVATGLGVQRMCGPYEDEVSVIHNERVLNMRLANARIWKAKQTIKSFLDRLWPGKVIGVSDMNDFEGEKMADVYPSSAQSEMMTVAFAERRTGVSDMQAASSRLGTRTPATSAMSYMQAANRRFTPAFRNMRTCVAAAIRQCLYRTQERILAKDKDAIKDVMAILGPEKGAKFIELMKKVDDLVDAVDIQVTAASVSINREADRQNMVMLAQLYEKYAQSRIQLTQLADNAPTPDQKALAEALIIATVRLMRKIIRSFETISDVDAYLAEVKGVEEMTGQLPPQVQQGLLGLTGQLGAAAQSMPMPIAPVENGAPQ